MDIDKNLPIVLFVGLSGVKDGLVQRLLEKRSNDIVVVGSGTSEFPLVLPHLIDFIIPNDLGLQVALSKLDSLFEPEPVDFIFEIKNYFSDLADVDLSFLDSGFFGFFDRNGNKVPDYVKFYGGDCGRADLRFLYKGSNYKSLK